MKTVRKGKGKEEKVGNESRLALTLPERIREMVRKYGSRNLRHWEGFPSALLEFGLSPSEVTDEAVSAASLELHQADQRMRQGVEEYNALADPNFFKERTNMSESTATKAPTKGVKASKAPAKASTNRHSKDGQSSKGINKPQLRVLQFLAKTGQEADRGEIAKGAPCDLANLTELVGSHDDDKRKENDSKHYLSLITLGYVKRLSTETPGGGTKHSYVITASGKKVAEKAAKEAAEAGK